MRLYLVQHGQAHPKEVDPDPGLTDKGKKDVEKNAAFLRLLAIEVSAVWESGKKRATQTAEILASSLTSQSGIVRKSGMAPMDPVAPVAEQIASLQSDHIIVGHLPFLSRLVSHLVLGKESPEIVTFRQGGTVCLEKGSSGQWIIAWMVVPDLL